MTAEKKDTFQKITDIIVKAIEEGAPSYRMPWRVSGNIPCSPVNAVTQRPYRGINVLVLWATSDERCYASGTWATYKQWQQLGAQVRKGEKSTNVVYWSFVELQNAVTDAKDDTDRQTKKRSIPLARDYWVFNAEQVDGYVADPAPLIAPEKRIESAEQFFRCLDVNIQRGGNRAFYRPVTDSVHMPSFTSFENPALYYSVLSHETTHWSGAESRLNRNLASRFGSESYAAEELIAELGAAFLCAQLGVPTDPRTDHAPYISDWLKLLKTDKRAIFTAAAKAQEAVDWMNRYALSGMIPPTGAAFNASHEPCLGEPVYSK